MDITPGTEPVCVLFPGDNQSSTEELLKDSGKVCAAPRDAEQGILFLTHAKHRWKAFNSALRIVSLEGA